MRNKSAAFVPTNSPSESGCAAFDWPAKVHRHFGVYGICYRHDSGELLVIRKVKGPYTGRYDLPGGSIGPGESLTQALSREFREEVGSDVRVLGNLGVHDCLVKWDFRDTTHTHHIAGLFRVSLDGEPKIAVCSRIDADQAPNDSRGSLWRAASELNIDNASPLVLMALEEKALPFRQRLLSSRPKKGSFFAGIRVS